MLLKKFFVRLHDTMGGSKVAVGNFDAIGPHEALNQAEKKYPGLFKSMQTKSWVAVAIPCDEKGNS